MHFFLLLTGSVTVISVPCSSGTWVSVAMELRIGSGVLGLDISILNVKCKGC
jgi:hypothetical protein